MAKLTAKQVNNVKDGVLFDGEGLYLKAKNEGKHKSWVLRTTFQGKRIDVGLGSAHLLSLAEAREEARRLRKGARLGVDPRRSRRRDELTFEQAAHRVHKTVAPTISNEKARKQWITTVETYACPSIGDKAVKDVT